MSVRTYNPSVRVGNWNEDIQLEEDTLKDFLARRDRGELLIQRSAQSHQEAYSQVDVSVSRDGNVHFGDTVMLVNPNPKDSSRSAMVISGGADSVTGSGNIEASSRTALKIVSIDGSADGDSLKYGQPFYICNMQGRFLYSDRATFGNAAKKSRHNPVKFHPEPCHLCEWMIKGIDHTFRMEMEHTDVPANKNLIFTHAKTNQNLCLEKDYSIRTAFGQECEVSTCTKLNSHKAEEDVNHFMIMVKVPGDGNLPVTPQQ